MVGQETAASSHDRQFAPPLMLPASSIRIHRPVLAGILDALMAIFHHGRHAEQVVDETLKHQPKWGARDRRLFATTVYELVRWWRRESWRAGLSDTDTFGPALTPEACARVWAAWWRASGGRTPDIAELNPSWFGLPGVLPDPASAPAAIQASLPDWLHDHAASALRSAWPRLRTSLNAPAEVWLRTNRLKTTPEALVQSLAGEGIEAHADGSESHPDAVRLAGRARLQSTTAFQQGLCEIQDAGSQEIAPFLQPLPGERLIDSCAGAGGKSLHLAALMKNQGEVVALDVHAWKLAALESRARRAGATIIHTRAADTPDALTPLHATADRLLIDAPCSGLGVLRRHPDTKWKLQPADLVRLRQLQAEILDQHSRLLKPGGTLVYATCSFLPEENSDQIQAFLDRQPAGTWSLEAESLLLPDATRPGVNHDAFYMARLRFSGR